MVEFEESAEPLSKIKKLTIEYANDLTKKEIDYITNFDHRPNNIYGKSLDLKCEVCKELEVGSHVKLGKGNNKTPFNIKAKMDCSVRDFIYLINCNGCKEQ